MPRYQWGFPVGTVELDAVLAAPDDDAPRHAFSAWLQTIDSDQARATALFIDRSLELFRAWERDPRSDALSAIPDDNIFWRSEGNWWRRTGPKIALYSGLGWAHEELSNNGMIEDVWYSRGFAEHCAVRAKTFLEIADELFAAAPIRYLTLTYCKGEHHDDLGIWRDLLASPYLDRIRFLRIPVRIHEHDNRFTRLNELTDSDLAELAASPHVRGLRGLDLEDATKVRGDGFAALAQSKNLPELNAVICKVFDYAQYDTAFGPMGPIRRSYVGDKLSPIAAALEQTYGRIPWLHAEETYGADLLPEKIVAHSVRSSLTEKS
ncbi:MAG TPA: hypothetical protein VGC41_27230 [Kofleriaceae bacterium]